MLIINADGIVGYIRNKERDDKMRVTKEDAKRIIDELPKFYKEMSVSEFERIYGKPAGKNVERPIEVADVVLAMVGVFTKGEVPMFAKVGDPNIRVVILDRVESKKCIEHWYRNVKTRKKALAIEDVYKYANYELNNRTKFNVEGAIQSVLKLNKTFDKAIEIWSPVDVDGIYTEGLNEMKETVETLTNKKFTVEFPSNPGMFTVARVVPTLDSRLEKLFTMVNKQDYRSLVGSLNGIVSAEAFDAMYTTERNVIKNYLNSVDVAKGEEFVKTVNFGTHILEYLIEKNGKTVADCYSKIMEVRYKYDKQYNG